MEPTTRQTLPACEPCARRTEGQTLFNLVTFTHGWRHVHGGGQPPIDELCTLCPEVATTWVVGSFSRAGLALLNRGGQRPRVLAPCPDELVDVGDVGDGHVEPLQVHDVPRSLTAATVDGDDEYVGTMGEIPW